MKRLIGKEFHISKEQIEKMTKAIANETIKKVHENLEKNKDKKLIWNL